MTRHENGPRKPTRTPGRKPQRKTPDASSPETEAAAPAERQRIAKLMARVGLCSRRDAEAWIVDGRVTLNGVVLTSPAQDVGPEDTILVDGIPLPEAEKTRLFLFHKPRGLVTSDHDPEGRQTVTDYLRETWPEGPRVVTVGRLDINTEGLLLLTNDGGLARVLELPATGWVRRYRVRAKGETDQGVLDRLRDGVTIDGIEYAGIEAKLDRAQGANSWLTMGLREGKNREIKRVLEHIGLEVNRLIRLSFGPFQLLDLPEGKVEEVRTRVLRDQLGETLAAEAGVDLPEEPQAAPTFRAETRILPRGARPGRETAGQDRAGKGALGKGARDKAPRGKTGGGFADKPRDGERSAMRRDAPSDEAPAKRERPVAGTRRHVSVLRTAEAEDLRKGPRKRVERTDTKDRKDRTVAVERLVAARPEPRARRGVGRFASREGAYEGGQERGAREPRQERGAREPGQERGARSPGRATSRDHASPSAMAKRVRIARSGGAEAAREPKAFPARAPRGDRPAARGPTGGKDRSVKPWADVAVSEERPARRARDERPARPPREDKPRGDAERPRPARTDTREERKPFAARSFEAKSSTKSFAAKPRAAERPRSEARPRSDAPRRETPRGEKPWEAKPRDTKSRDDKPRGEKPRHAGAERRVGERNAGERDARKAGKRPAPARGGVRPRGPDRGSKGPPRGPAKGPRAPKPRD
jgi:23S rRNA pseudouridine2605 synthase